MKRWATGLALLSLLLPAWDGKDRVSGTDIRPDGEGWGKAAPATVRKVLQYAAREIRPHVSERELDPILVSPKGGPILLYKRGPKGEYYVRLDTGDCYWCQYIYQFSHELCHILCRWKDDPEGRRNREHPVKWFEESLCEMASLYVLRRAAETWKTDPPYSHWKSYYKALKKYVDPLMEEGGLEEGATFPEWFGEHRKALEKTATNRSLNRVVAVHLLPFFEETPEKWRTVLRLNAMELEKGAPFETFLSEWRSAVPEEDRAFVGEIATAFGIELKREKAAEER